MNTTDIPQRNQRQAGVGHPDPTEGASPFALGVNANAIRYQRIDLSSARDNIRIPISGNVIAAYQSSAPLAYAKIRLRRDSADEFIIRDGFVLRGLPFSEIFISNIAMPGQYLGLLTVLDPKSIFDLRLPPPITAEIAGLSGLGFNYRFFSAASATEYSAALLNNPTTSGIIAYVSNIRSNTSDTDFVIIPTAADLATILGDLSLDAPADIASTYINYTIGAATKRAPALEFYTGTTTVSLPATGRVSSNFVEFYGTNFSGEPTFTIMPGYAILLTRSAVNTQMVGIVAWYELPQ